MNVVSRRRKKKPQNHDWRGEKGLCHFAVVNYQKEKLPKVKITKAGGSALTIASLLAPIFCISCSCQNWGVPVF